MKSATLSFNNPVSSRVASDAGVMERYKPPKLGGLNIRLCTCRFPSLITLLAVGRPRWGRFCGAVPLSPHHLLRKMIRGYGTVTAPQS